MRIRLPMPRLAIFAILFVLALLLFLPLRLVLGSIPGLTAREASGSVWGGQLKEARAGPVALGDLSARVAPTPLLVGRLRLELERGRTAADRLRAALSMSRTRLALEGASGLIPVDGVFAPLPVASLDLTDLTVEFRDGQCDRAAGLVRANIAGDVAGLPLPVALNGAARCDRGAVLLPLASGSGGEGLALRLFGDGRYEAQLTVRATEPGLIARLTGAGFAIGPGGYMTAFRGRF
jgi:general secretion pathway protein N